MADQRIKCPVCGYLCNGSLGYRHHIARAHLRRKEATRVDKVKAKCFKCGQLHDITHEPADKPMKCGECLEGYVITPSGKVWLAGKEV